MAMKNPKDLEVWKEAVEASEHNFEKTAAHFWDEIYLATSRENSWLARFASEHNLARFSPLHLRLALLLKKYLIPVSNKRVIELGCAPGRWLVYFNQKFGYDVYGIDYSKVGYAQTEKMLRLHRIEGKIICSDIFDSSFRSKYEGMFDVVYSLGLIDHFDDPSQVLDIHQKLLKKNGLLLITMPNYSDGTLYRKCVKGTKTEKDLLRVHNTQLMKIDKFKEYLDRLEDIEILMLSYIGPLTFPIYVKHGSIEYLFKLSVLQMIGCLTFFLNQPALSSMIVLIGRKR
jgi:SAM-dependent methyltransferase